MTLHENRLFASLLPPDFPENQSLLGTGNQDSTIIKGRKPIGAAACWRQVEEIPQWPHHVDVLLVLAFVERYELEFIGVGVMILPTGRTNTLSIGS